MILLLVLSLFAARQFLVPEMEAAAIAPNPPTGTLDEGGDAFQVEPEAEPASDVSAEGEPLEGARRIVHVPGDAGDRSEEAPDFDSWSVKDEHLEAYAKHNLEKALAGDLGAANRVVRAIQRCVQAPKSMAEVERWVAIQVNRYEKAVARGTTPLNTPDETEIRERAISHFESCQLTNQLFTRDLRKRLEELANQGHVMARYLYAMWSPDVFGQPDAFFVLQDWAERATNYSLANLADGELAGMLAFGEAYALNFSFAGPDFYLGFAFLIASMECGLNFEHYTNLVERFLSPEQYEQRERDPRSGVLSMAESLKGLCLK